MSWRPTARNRTVPSPTTEVLHTAEEFAAQILTSVGLTIRYVIALFTAKVSGVVAPGFLLI